MCRRCGEPDGRGSAEGRRTRKRWLLSADSGHGGDGEKVPCWNYVVCGTVLAFDTMEVDRIIAAWQCQECDESYRHHHLEDDDHAFRGGTYRRSNIRPSCGPCNRERNRGNPWGHRVDPEEVRCMTR